MSKPHIESCYRLDVNALRRAGHISRTGQGHGGMRWGDEDNPLASISFSCIDGERLNLSYAVDDVPVSQSIRVVWTACHYGNERPWLACPACGRRAGSLFYRVRRFACRRCQRLCYASQLENAGQRGLGLYHKLSNRFESDDEQIYKPKGMHWKTFDRLLARMEDANARSMRGLLGWLANRS